MMCTTALQDSAHSELEKLSQERLATIEFKVAIGSPNGDFFLSNVCSLANLLKAKKNNIYFNPTVYDPGQEGSRKKLIRDLRLAAIQGGDMVVSNGGRETKRKPLKDGSTSVGILRCQCSFMYQGTKWDVDAKATVKDPNYRSATICSDRKNARPGHQGRHGPHRTTTVKCLSKNQPRCPFNITICELQSGYFVTSGMGIMYHKYHPRRDALRTPTKLLVLDEAQLLKDLSSARAPTAAAVNAHFVRSSRAGTPTILSQHQIKGFCRNLQINTSGGVSDNTTQEELGPIDDLFTFLVESGASYVALLQGTKQEEHSGSSAYLLYNETRESGAEATEAPVPLTHLEERAAAEYAHAHRATRGVRDDQEMMVGIAYCLPFERKQFGLISWVVHIDATACTNKEDRPLVTVTAKDACGHMFTVVRAFLPNEQAWLYKWLFQTVFPALLGKDVLSKVKIIVTDGDSQEIQQLDAAIVLYFKNAFRIRCSWHIIDRGWERYLSAALLGGSSRKKKIKNKRRRTKQAMLTEKHQCARVIYRWMFSWAQPSFCESEEEYKLSKALFMQYVKSEKVEELLGSTDVERLLNFVRKSVFTQEDRMCY